MFESPEIVRMAHALSSHAAQRQAAIAGNVAHADTPGYVARDARPFAETYAQTGPGFAPRATRPTHMNRPADAGQSASGAVQLVAAETAGARNPNGNTVSLEREMMRAAEVRHQHDMALGVYRSASSILRTSLGR